MKRLNDLPSLKKIRVESKRNEWIRLVKSVLYLSSKRPTFFLRTRFRSPVYSPSAFSLYPGMSSSEPESSRAKVGVGSGTVGVFEGIGSSGGGFGFEAFGLLLIWVAALEEADFERDLLRAGRAVAEATVEAAVKGGGDGAARGAKVSSSSVSSQVTGIKKGEQHGQLTRLCCDNV